MKPEDLDDFLVWAAIGVVAGGRIGYVLFYDLQRYIANPLDIVAVWQGGMSFHGGLLGTTLAMILFARRRGIRSGRCSTSSRPACRSALGLVRIANFVNSELWGKLTSVPWAFEFPNGGPFPRHPTQLYEAGLEGLVLFLVLRLLTHRCLKLGSPGFVCGAFVAGYGLARIFVEFFREPDQQIGYLLGGWLTMGMVLSVPMVLVGIWAMATAKPAAAARPRLTLDAAAAKDRPADRGERPAAGRRLHGALPVRSRRRLLHDARAVRRGRRLHHRAGDQPDVRRADRRLGARAPGRRSAGRCRSRWPKSAPDAAR